MTQKKIVRRLLRISLVLLGLIVIGLIVFHFWFINHAKSLLEDTVDESSNGKLQLKIEKLSYDYFSRKMVIKKAVFISTDTTTASSAYRFSVEEIRLRLRGLLPLVLNKKLLIDSMHLQSPDIRVTTLRSSKDTTRNEPRDVSLPYELGKVYHSIQDALKVLKVNRFHISNGRFSLRNKAAMDQQPLHISNIDFQIENLQVDTSQFTGQEKILFSDNVTLKSHNQDILFPDGRHRLSFSQFRINLQRKLVEFDSCTIAAGRTDSSTSAFSVFFDTLKLTNIDFDTLYRAEVIKADSVYCLNPQFNLEVDAGKRKGAKKPMPKLENIIQQLTGDLLLGFVVVQNAGFNIKTIKDGQPNSFVFSNNNFEMQGLSVAHNAPKTIKVKSFAMAIRNYENFIKDSTYSIKFDSVRFKDDQIILSRFLFNKLDHGRIVNTFSVPEFRLEGLSWDDLVFEKKLKARSATMYQPHINYTARENPRKRQTLFQSLGAVNEYMDLEHLDIIDGAIDLKLRNNLRIEMENADLSVKSQSLLSSTRLSGIKNSLIALNFDHGKIQAGSTIIELKDIIYKGENGQFAAGTVLVKDNKEDIDAEMFEVAVNKMLVDETNGNVQAEGIRWNKANIRLSVEGNDRGNSKMTSSFDLKKIEGKNTSFTGMIKNNAVSTRLDYINIDELSNLGDERLQLNIFYASGTGLKISGKDIHLVASDYEWADNRFSSFRNLELSLNTPAVKGSITIPSLSLVTNMQRLIKGDLAAEIFSPLGPIVKLRIDNEQNNSGKNRGKLPKIRLDKMRMKGADIDIVSVGKSDSVIFKWNGNPNPYDHITILGLRTGEGNATADSIGSYLSSISFTNAKGRTFTTGNGRLVSRLRDVQISQGESTPLEWKASIEHLDAQELSIDSMGKNQGKLFLQKAELKGLHINDKVISNMQKLVAANLRFRLDQFTGQYNSDRSDLRWYNAGYDRNNNSFFLDSISYKPTPARDSFLLTKEYQTDYIRTGAGAVLIGPVDLDAIIKDSVWKVKKAVVQDAYFIDYKDKSLPFNAGIIKLLPVNMLKNIPVKLSIDSVLLHNARVEYTEVNEKTKSPGIIPVTRMEAVLNNIRNYELNEADSLGIRATGFLMDKVWTRLQVKESYLDSLGGFRMTLRMQPADLTVFNSALVPLASVKLLSGKLDTLYMRAVGREYLALGEMKMFYRDLKIQVLKKGMNDTSRTVDRFSTFIANSFVIRKNNDSRIGNVFFIRNRDRSAVNYLVKIAMSGISSSIGAKSNKKMLKRYEKELRERSLPPIGFE